MKAHPAAELFPMMDDEALQRLAEDIKQHGQLVPIVMHEGEILDGRNRWRACELAGVEPKTVEWNGTGSVIAWVLSVNAHRRHLTESQRAVIAAEALPMLEEEARERARQAGIRGRQTRWAHTEPQAWGEANLPHPIETFAERHNVPVVMVDHVGSPPPEQLPERIGNVVVFNAPREPDIAPTRSPEPPRRAPQARDVAGQSLSVSPRSVQTAKTVAQARPELLAKVKAGEITLNKAAHQVRQEQAKAKAASAPAPLIVPARLEVADVTERMPLENDSVHLIVTSPPYGLDKPYRDSSDPFASWPRFMEDWLREAYRVTASTGRLALNIPLDTTKGGVRPSYALALAAARRAGWTYRTSIVWDEGNSTKGNRALGSVNSASAPHPIAQVEMIILCCKGEWKRAEPGISDITPEEWQAWGNGLWRFSGESHAWEGHPAPFPKALPYRLIKLLSFVGDTVLDPFVGSGTTALVATDLKRQAIGFDISPEYIASAKRRLVLAQERSA